MANNQIDLTPATTPSLGLHVHTPTGSSASVFNHPTDFPNAAFSAALPSAGKPVKASVTGTPGQVIRFANPS